MNKLRLIQILKQLLDLYKNEELNAETYQLTVENTPKKQFTDNLISYYETDFLCYLFTNIPYYQIFNFLNGFCVTLNRLNEENKNFDSVISLLQAYLSDLIDTISARISTEVATHIYELAMIYYQCNHLNPEIVIPRLLKNKCDPAFLTSVDTAENIYYEQETLPGFTISKENLRESISRSNFRKRNSVENNTQKMITRYFDEKSFENLLEETKKCLEVYQKENQRDGEILGEEILMRLKLIYKKSLKTWQTPKESPEENMQYKIEF